LRLPTVLLSASQTVYGAAIVWRNEAMTEFFDVVKLGANIGARIDGVALGGDLDGETVACLDALLTQSERPAPGWFARWLAAFKR